jgi:NAD(P)H dehydrogenase (quinone)
MIVVTGATGSIGRQLVRRLAGTGVPFRAMARDPAQASGLGCDSMTGDFDDPASLAAAFEGAGSVFLNAGGAVPTDGPQPMIAQQCAAIDAARQAGVRRVVKVSVWGARRDGRLAQAAHWQIERHLEESGLDWVMLQPSGFMQNFVTGISGVTADGALVSAYGNGAVSYIDCADIAACAAALLTGRWHARQRFVLTGPQSLTQDQVAGKLSAAWQRPVRHVSLTPAALAIRLKQQGLPAAFADDVAVLCEAVARGELAATTAAVHDLTGAHPRSFDQFLASTPPPPAQT